MRFLLATAGLFVLAAPALADVNYLVETETYRFGGTYSVVPAETPTQCAQACAGDDRCLAWSHSAVSDAHAASCELKQTAGLVEFRPGFASGISVSHAAKFTDLEIGPSPSDDVLAGGSGYRGSTLAGSRRSGVSRSANSTRPLGSREPQRVTNWSFAPEGGETPPNSSSVRLTSPSSSERRRPPPPPPDQGPSGPDY